MAKRENQECTASVKTEEGSRGGGTDRMEDCKGVNKTWTDKCLLNWWTRGGFHGVMDIKQLKGKGLRSK